MAVLLRAMLAAALGFGGYWLVFASGEDVDGPVAIAPTPTVAATVPAEPLQPTLPVMTDQAVPTPTATPTPTEDPDRPGVGHTVQVLYGADVDEEAYSDGLEFLRPLGFTTITETGQAISDRAETTIFYDAEFEDLARAIQALDPRFAVIEPNEEELDGPGLSDHDIHIIFGQNWLDEAGAADADADADAAATDEPTDGATEPEPGDG